MPAPIQNFRGSLRPVRPLGAPDAGADSSVPAGALAATAAVRSSPGDGDPLIL